MVAVPAGVDGPRALYDSHFGFVWRNLRRLGVPEQLAEDAAQDVFLAVHRRFASYDARWSRVETWLYGFVLRVASDYRRSGRRRSRWFDLAADPEVELRHETAGAPAADEVLVRREAVVLLERALDTIGSKKRAVLVMVDIEQMSVPEAAEALGVNVNTAYWRLGAARREFQRGLERLRGSTKGYGR